MAKNLLDFFVAFHCEQDIRKSLGCLNPVPVAL
jgi:hypothetical protein